MADTIRAKLTDAFAPTELDVHDDSEAHRGHGGWREGGETHFQVRIRSAKFEGLSRVAAQRAVMTVLADELAGPIHALELDVQA